MPAGAARCGPIFVVDGDAESRAALVETLRRSDYDVLGFADGESARVAAHREVPALVVVDGKTMAPDELLVCVEGVVARDGGASAGAAKPLTSREREVLRLLADGLSSHQVAAALGLSRSTVATHIEHIFRKLDVHNRVEAIARAYRDGLVP